MELLASGYHHSTLWLRLARCGEVYDAQVMPITYNYIAMVEKHRKTNKSQYIRKNSIVTKNQ